MKAHEHFALGSLTEATSRICAGTIHGCHYWTSWCEPQKASGHCRAASFRVKSSELQSCILHCTAPRTPLAARFSSVVVTSVPCHFEHPSPWRFWLLFQNTFYCCTRNLICFIDINSQDASMPLQWSHSVSFASCMVTVFRWQMANGRGSSNASACSGLSFSCWTWEKHDETDIVQVHIEGETEVAPSPETVHWVDSDDHNHHLDIWDRLVNAAF